MNFRAAFKPDWTLKNRRYKNHYRIRVGDHRIMFVLDRLNALVYDVSHRSNVYKKLS